ncbi:c-type cytochrome [Mucilaginibacter sabulilitoris]|uniref:C-type cytochrome n=1 Tax=Mucilaginibacter sabulilitoris TaxID=1173583 RepID=A0ABZ0TJI3_9SPHI|nr:c-type cytochrome [Mucilaginibacter sabulilitoris]WPU92358.1 c-type cytochrome [Mucilaginibacter sabulilitoris]
MKKFLKYTLYTVIVVVLIVVAGISYVTLALPNVGEPETIKVEATPQRIERGKYLANNITLCMDCHSTRDWSIFAGPMKPGTLGAGGEKFDANVGFPGDVQVPNITPYHLKNWTDGELFRAITTGVKKDGSAIFPLMPWPSYSKMGREDVYAIIAYLRSVQPIEVSYPQSKLNFPLNILVHTMPQKATLGTIPNERDTVKYGEYLVTIAACKDCHTQDKQGKLIEGLEYAGGHAYTVPGAGTVRSANITPDKQTGIGSWTKEQFLSRFKEYADSSSKPIAVKPGEYQTIMPWYRYGAMKTGDLEAIYAYLKTIKPKKNQVNKFTPAATRD